MVDDYNTRKKVLLVAVLRRMSKGGSQRAALGNVSHMKHDNSCMIVNVIIAASYLCASLSTNQCSYTSHLKTTKDCKRTKIIRRLDSKGKHSENMFSKQPI